LQGECDSVRVDSLARAVDLLRTERFDAVYADTFAPLPSTLVSPADRIKPLVVQGYVGSGALPPSTGILISVGGNTIDLALATDAAVDFMNVDGAGLSHFRVWERFALRVKAEQRSFGSAFPDWKWLPKRRGDGLSMLRDDPWTHAGDVPRDRRSGHDPDSANWVKCDAVSGDEAKCDADWG